MGNTESKITKIKLIIMVISIWLMVSAFFINNIVFMKTNVIVMGILFAVFSFWLDSWQKWFIFVSGLILFLISFAPFYSETYITVVSGATNTQISLSKALTWNIIVGIITLLVIFVPPKIED
jgi:hypothetical protein